MSNVIAIAPIGIILRTDKNGFLVSQSASGYIKDLWKQAVNDITEAYKDILGAQLHSIYIRGSLSRGTALEGASDIDAFGVIKEVLTDYQTAQLRQSKNVLEEKYPFCLKIEMEAKLLQPIISGHNRIARIILKISSACVYGYDLASDLPDVKPGPQSVIHSFAFSNFMRGKITEFNSDERTFSIAWCRSLTKRILRVGCELVMEREQAFTRDLYPCYQLFSKYYPEKEAEMMRVLEFAINPTPDYREIHQLLADFSPWLISEIQEVFGRENGSPASAD